MGYTYQNDLAIQLLRASPKCVKIHLHKQKKELETTRLSAEDHLRHLVVYPDSVRTRAQPLGARLGAGGRAWSGSQDVDH